MENVVEYVKSLPCSQIKPQKVGANVLDEGVVQAIQKEAQTINVRSPGSLTETNISTTTVCDSSLK